MRARVPFYSFIFYKRIALNCIINLPVKWGQGWWTLHWRMKMKIKFNDWLISRGRWCCNRIVTASTMMMQRNILQGCNKQNIKSLIQRSYYQYTKNVAAARNLIITAGFLILIETSYKSWMLLNNHVPTAEWRRALTTQLIEQYNSCVGLTW